MKQEKIIDYEKLNRLSGERQLLEIVEFCRFFDLEQIKFNYRFQQEVVKYLRTLKIDVKLTNNSTTFTFSN